MKEAPRCLTGLAVGIVLMAGCAGIARAPPQSAVAAASTEAIVPIDPRAAAATPAEPSPSSMVGGGALASAPVARPAEPPRPEITSGNQAKPAASPAPARAKIAASPPPEAPQVKTRPPTPPGVKSAVPPPLDLKSLETRLKETKAIGVFTKLALKNQIDELLERFRAFYQGRIETSLAELRRSFDMLMMKTLALLQDADPPLAGALVSSREAIWGILSDPAKFSTV